MLSLAQTTHSCLVVAMVRDMFCSWQLLKHGHLPSSLGTVDDFMTDAAMKAAFLTLMISFSSFTDRRSAKALATSTVGNPESDRAALHMSVNLPSGLSYRHVPDIH